MNNIELIFPKRMVHLDFHTGPNIPNVAASFDPEEFAEHFKRAHVDSVTVFAKCHHGHLYYDSQRPERHPGLDKNCHLLEQQIEALHRVGIRAPIYLSVQCDEYAANNHPEWIALDENLAHVKQGGAFNAAWQIMDLNSPFQDYMAEQLQEVLDKFAPTDGIFMDMCWDQPSCSKWAISAMTAAGLDPRKSEHRAKHARNLALSYMRRYTAMTERAHQQHPPAGIWFNSRPKANLHQEASFLRHVEIECLPTGGWGYSYFPYVARLVRSLANLPTLSHTGRFFKSWGDNTSLKPPMALKYECTQILSQCMTSGIGDLLHPSGALSPAVYSLIGRVYEYIERCEPFQMGGQLMSEVALVADPELGDVPGEALIGGVRMLQQLRHQFDVVTWANNLKGYALVIIPESTKVTVKAQEILCDYLEGGGSVLLLGPACFDDDGKPVLTEQGIHAHGISPYSHTFLHVKDAVSEGLPDYGHVLYERGYRITPAEGANVLVDIGEPYFERGYQHFSGHEYTPESQISKYAGIIQHNRVVSISSPLMDAYGKHAAPFYRDLFRNVVKRLLPRPLVEAEGPSKLETTLIAVGNNRLILHLLSFSVERRAEGLDIVEDAIPLVNIRVRIRTEREPVLVFLAPEENRLNFTFQDGYVESCVTVLEGHSMLVLDFP